MVVVVPDIAFGGSAGKLELQNRIRLARTKRRLVIFITILHKAAGVDSTSFGTPLRERLSFKLLPLSLSGASEALHRVLCKGTSRKVGALRWDCRLLSCVSNQASSRVVAIALTNHDFGTPIAVHKPSSTSPPFSHGTLVFRHRHLLVDLGASTLLDDRSFLGHHLWGRGCVLSHMSWVEW